MNDIEKKLEALKAEFLEKLEALRKEAEAQKKQEEPKPWKPEAGEEYFFVNNDLSIYCFCNYNDEEDRYNFEIGNCFRTGERAEQVAKKMRLLLRLEQLHDMLCPDYVPDWSSDDGKYIVIYDEVEKQWLCDVIFLIRDAVQVYFDSEETTQKVCDLLNGEDEENGSSYKSD